MAYLSNPKNTMAVLKKYGFHFQKKLGQNFLIDGNILEKMLAAAEITKDDFVLEIGSGIGTMTQHLCERAKTVAAVEIDPRLIPILGETLQEYDNVEIIHADVLKLDIAALARQKHPNETLKVVANLPYYITTPIIMGLLEQHIPADSITVMVQKEVADRMQAEPGSKDYGILSLAVQYYAKPQIAAAVPPDCFVPRPSVGSAIIRLTRHRMPPVEADEALMFRIIQASFQQRRKTLANGLGNAKDLPFSKQQIQESIKLLGWAENVRGETLTLAQFAELANLLKARSHSYFNK